MSKSSNGIVRLAVVTAGLAAALYWAQAAMSQGAAIDADNGARAGGAGARAGGPPPGPMAKTYEVAVQMQAGASSFKVWPGGGDTRHHGIGFIDPFGTAEYFCGKDFPEAKNYPMPDWAHGLFKALTGRDDALFCVYSVKDGTFVVYDSVPGTLTRFDNGGRDLIFNVVVDGTGAYKGATGVWMGRTEGVDPRVQVAPGKMAAETLLKLMTGYVKIPAAQTAAAGK
jgi:hypothetical protein